MHTMFFSIKRVHLRLIEIGKTWLRTYALTPARFDMMRIVLLHKDGITQSKIRGLLGVCAATVSRMLKSLEILGFVTRVEHDDDARERVVSITEYGRKKVVSAINALLDSKEAEWLALSGLDSDHEKARPKLAALQPALSSMRYAYDDKAAYIHPWRTDDLSPYFVTEIVDGRLVYGEDIPERFYNGSHAAKYQERPPPTPN